MYLRKAESRRTVEAPAKLNLYLEVLGRRNDGYHELETLMVPVRLYDTLSLVPTQPGRDGVPATGRAGRRVSAGAIHLHIRPAHFLAEGRQPDLPPMGEQNLVVRALESLRRQSGCQHGARIELVKRIPTAAGLGGASSDAAAVLRLANQAWGLDWSDDRLTELAAEVGSDVPFFLKHGAAVCRGRGERVEPVAGAFPLHFVIVKPPIGLNTRDVYHAHDQTPAATVGKDADRLEALLRALRRGKLTELGCWMGNRLQSAAAVLSPWIEQARAAFAKLDFLAHQLSGSGSAYFGLCRHASHARRLATILRTRQLGLVYITRSCR